MDAVTGQSGAGPGAGATKNDAAGGAADQLAWALGGLCAYYRLPFDAALLAQQFPPPHSSATLRQAGGALGLKIESRAWSRRAVRRWTFPCIAFVKAPAGPTQTTPPSLHAALLLKSDGERLLYLRAGEKEPRYMAVADFPRVFEKEILLVGAANAGAGASDPDGNMERPGFGFRWFIPQLLKYKSIWRDVLLASVAIQLVGLTTPLFTQVIIDKVVVHQTQSTLVAVGVALAMFMLFSSIMTWMRQYLVLHTGNRIDAVLGAQVFRHLLRLPMAYFERRPTGVLVARLRGVEDIRQFVSNAAVSLFLDVPFLFIFVAVMFAYSWQLTLIALGLLLLIVILSLLVTPLFRARLNQQFLIGARNQAFVTEYVSGMATVKSLQMEPILENRYGGLLADYLGAGFTTRRLANSYNVAANALEQIMTLAILVAGARLVMRNDGFTVGQLVAFQMFASRMSQPLLRLVGLWQDFQQAGISIRRLADVMDMPTEPYAVIPQRMSGREPAMVEFQNLSFRYSERHPYLYKNLSLTLKPGHLTVLMGPSGCGKSTLAKLMQAFYQPSDGAIKIDGGDIRALSANDLRAAFGVVPQETVLFSGTVYDNLALANPRAGFSEIVEAARMAEIHDTIEQLPQGYQTPLGEHGVGLSGGQRQRIAIARALLKKPRVLIFDEATSGLDPPTAEAFAHTINQLKGKVTMLFIAHQVPRGLQIDEVFSFGRQPQQPPVPPKNMSVVDDADSAKDQRSRINDDAESS